ncbi:MAG: aldo/keto reductase [Burkholderiaceae bacterium]
MEQRKLGSELSVSALGLGCMGMSEFYGPTSEAEALSTIDRALDLGISMFDSADIYGYGDNEVLLGKAMQGRRDRFIVATKFGILRSREDPELRGFNSHPDYVRQACDASLKRLGVDTIDLYYQHRLDPETPIEETVGAMADLVRSGKVRYLGLSEVGPRALRRAHAVHPIAAVQTEYSLWSRDVEPMIPVMRELGVGLVPYSPLGRGFLSGSFTNVDQLAVGDFRHGQPRFQGERFENNRRLVERFAQFAADKGCSPAQLALAWLLAQGPDVVPIPGTKRVSYLEDNCGAREVALDEPEIAELSALIPPEAVDGDRYADMSFVNRE